MSDAWTDGARRVDAAIRHRADLAHTGDFLLEVDGRMVWEAHYQPGELRDTFSMTKTVVGLLVGIATAEGRLTLAEHVEPGVTVEHLLTMTRGAEADFDDIDNVLELGGGWVEHIRSSRRPRHRPGTVFSYDNCGAHLLAAHLADRLGRSLEAYAAERLFGPLGIGCWSWPADPAGYSYGFGHLQLEPASLLSLGRLMLNGGRTPQGHCIVPEPWVTRMTTAATPGGPPEMCGYGYLTWVEPDNFFLGGWAGQHVTVVPAHRAVAVTTGIPDLLHALWQPARTEVVRHLLQR